MDEKKKVIFFKIIIRSILQGILIGVVVTLAYKFS